MSLVPARRARQPFRQACLKSFAPIFEHLKHCTVTAPCQSCMNTRHIMCAACDSLHLKHSSALLPEPPMSRSSSSPPPPGTIVETRECAGAGVLAEEACAGAGVLAEEADAGAAVLDEEAEGAVA